MKTLVGFHPFEDWNFGIKCTLTIHPLVERISTHLAYGKLLIKYDWFSSIQGLKFTVWNFILNSSALISAICRRKALFHYLNGGNSYYTGFTVYINWNPKLLGWGNLKGRQNPKCSTRNHRVRVKLGWKICQRMGLPNPVVSASFKEDWAALMVRSR